MRFYEQHYLEINEARWKAASCILAGLPLHQVPTCLDVGCGPGWFSKHLASFNAWTVRALDARADVIEEARRNAPGITFAVADFKSERDMVTIAPADLVFCFGLLYHLENPFKAIRTLARLSSRFLLIETQLIPLMEPLALLVEESHDQTQGLTFMALIPTLASLAKMLSRAGFTHIYEYRGDVDHPDFQETASRFRRRAIVVAAREDLNLDDMVRLEEPRTPKFNYSRQ